jgi:CRP-like cAMP-binding protein
MPTLKRQRFQHGEILLRRGDTPVYWFHIISGSVAASVPSHSGTSLPVDLYGAGSWFGEELITTDLSSALEFVCIGEVKAICLPMAEAKDAFKSEPDFANRVISLVISRNRYQVELHSLTMFSGPELRVVVGLALLLKMQLKNWSETPKEKTSDQFDMQISQTMLSLICRVSRSAFSECIANLIEAGWIRSNYGSLKFLQVRKWMLFLESYRSNRVNAQKSTIEEIINAMNQADTEEIIAMAISRQILNEIESHSPAIAD